jgi:hypothetical protein
MLKGECTHFGREAAHGFWWWGGARSAVLGGLIERTTGSRGVRRLLLGVWRLWSVFRLGGHRDV